MSFELNSTIWLPSTKNLKGSHRQEMRSLHLVSMFFLFPTYPELSHLDDTHVPAITSIDRNKADQKSDLCTCKAAGPQSDSRQYAGKEFSSCNSARMKSGASLSNSGPIA